MADWVDIDNTTIEPDAPLISSTVFALRDNPKAIAEGAAGAPRVDHTALQTDTGMRDWVLGRTAGASAGVLGTYALLYLPPADGPSRDHGYTSSGSNLRYSNVLGGSVSTGAAPAGTWRLMGYIDDRDSSPAKTSLWLRIN